jgi:integrase
MAINLGWLNGRVILAKHCWPRIKSKVKRAITWDEHQRIVAAEKNKERRLYYEMLWEIGSSQTDAAKLTRDNFADGVLVYVRKKTGTQASIRIGERLKSILDQLSAEGLLFPKISTLCSVARSAEFCRRCHLLGIIGISLHSYRYAWAERAFSVGYPERFAQAALGHDSRAIHHAYARKSVVAKIRWCWNVSYHEWNECLMVSVAGFDSFQ